MENLEPAAIFEESMKDAKAVAEAAKATNSEAQVVVSNPRAWEDGLNRDQREEASAWRIKINPETGREFTEKEIEEKILGKKDGKDHTSGDDPWAGVPDDVFEFTKDGVTYQRPRPGDVIDEDDKEAGKNENDRQDSEERKENTEKKIWYPKIKDDLDEATVPLRIWKDSDDHGKGKREQRFIDADKEKIKEAIDRLHDKGINVTPLTLDNKSRRVVWFAKRIVFDGKEELPELSKKDSIKLLRAMGFDVDKMIEEGKKTEGAATNEPPKPPTGEPPKSPSEAESSEKNKKETLGSYVGKNEVILNELLLQNWGASITTHPERARLARMVELSDSIHRQAYLDRFRAGDESVYADMFALAQDAYLKVILGNENYIKIFAASEALKKQEEGGEDVSERRQTFGGRLTEFASKVYMGERGHWYERAEGESMKKRLDTFLNDKYNKSEVVKDSSDKGVVVRMLKTVYLQADEIRTTQEIKVAKESKAELLRDMIKIHDLTVVLDAPAFKFTDTSPRPELLQKVDNALVAMLSLKKEDGTSIVPKVVETYDTVMRESYSRNGRELNIDAEEIRKEVENRLRGFFGDENEAALFMKMGRDVCRITGVDACYGLPAEMRFDVKGQGLALTVPGAFMRGLFNYNKNLIGYGTDVRLTGGIELGVYPFWNKLRKVDDVVSAPLNASDIDSMVLTKMKGVSVFEDWVRKLKDYGEAKKAESDFMNAIPPTLEIFVTKVIPAYSSYLQFTDDKGRGYYLRRLDSCIPFFIERGERRDRLEASIVNIFMKDGVFDGKGLFSSVPEMKRYFEHHKLFPKTRPAELKSRDERAKEAGARGDWLGVLKEMFK